MREFIRPAPKIFLVNFKSHDLLRGPAKASPATHALQLVVCAMKSLVSQGLLLAACAIALASCVAADDYPCPDQPVSYAGRASHEQ